MKYQATISLANGIQSWFNLKAELAIKQNGEECSASPPDSNKTQAVPICDLSSTAVMKVGSEQIYGKYDKFLEPTPSTLCKCHPPKF